MRGCLPLPDPHAGTQVKNHHRPHLSPLPQVDARIGQQGAGERQASKNNDGHAQQQEQQVVQLATPPRFLLALQKKTDGRKNHPFGLPLLQHVQQDRHSSHQ